MKIPYFLQESSDGFTLIELMIGISIVALFSSLTVLKMGIFEPSRSEYDEFISFARYQHARSLRSNKVFYLRFYPSRDRIEVENDNTILEEFSLNDWSLKIPSRKFTVKFTPAGTTGPDRIKFSDPSGNPYFLDVHQTLGIVSVSGT